MLEQCTAHLRPKQVGHQLAVIVYQHAKFQNPCDCGFEKIVEKKPMGIPIQLKHSFLLLFVTICYFFRNYVLLADFNLNR